MSEFFVRLTWSPNGSNEVRLMDEDYDYKWHTKTSMTGLAMMLKSNIENGFSGVSVELKPVDATTDLIVIKDPSEMWDFSQFAKRISKVLAIQEFIDKKEWHEPDEVLGVKT